MKNSLLFVEKLLMSNAKCFIKNMREMQSQETGKTKSIYKLCENFETGDLNDPGRCRYKFMFNPIRKCCSQH